MGAETGSEGQRRGHAGKHRRSSQMLIARRDHLDRQRRRRFTMPAPSPSALVGLGVLVLIAVGVVHLSGSGTAVPLEPVLTAQEESQEESTVQDTPGRATTMSTAATASDPTASAAGPSTAADPATAEIVVHVSGAVAAPGVVTLPGESRVDDALRAAGGPTDEADLSAVNLARPLVDGEQIHVPVPGEAPRPEPVAASSTSEETAGAAGGAPIDVNTASLAELEELPGVGPAIAQRIIEHREKNGPFTAVDGLLEVSGIGPATLEEIRGRATV